MSTVPKSQPRIGQRVVRALAAGATVGLALTALSAATGLSTVLLFGTGVSAALSIEFSADIAATAQ